MKRQLSTEALRTTSEEAKSQLLSRLHTSLTKLRYLFDIQGREFWYMEMVRLTPQELQIVNDDFVRALDEDFYELGIRLGSSMLGEELTVELYKFNETLTRLFSHTQQRCAASILAASTHSKNSDVTSIRTAGTEGLINTGEGLILPELGTERADSSLLLTTLIKLLIVKLAKLSELLRAPSRAVTPVESKLIDDVLTKNISSRVLRPYHNLLSARAHSHISSIY